VLADRQAGVHRRDVGERRGGELREDLGDVAAIAQAPDQPVLGVAGGELPAEGVEQHDADAVEALRQALEVHAARAPGEHALDGGRQ
jgi:hypothetical protein